MVPSGQCPAIDLSTASRKNWNGIPPHRTCWSLGERTSCRKSAGLLLGGHTSPSDSKKGRTSSQGPAHRRRHCTPQALTEPVRLLYADLNRCMLARLTDEPNAQGCTRILSCLLLLREGLYTTDSADEIRTLASDFALNAGRLP